MFDLFSEPLQEYEAYGWTAAALTSLAFLPQAYRVFMRDDVGDLSLATFTIYAWGLVLWVVYGYMMDDRPTIFSGVAGLVPVLYIWNKIRNKNKIAEETVRASSGKHRVKRGRSGRVA